MIIAGFAIKVMLLRKLAARLFQYGKAARTLFFRIGPERELFWRGIVLGVYIRQNNGLQLTLRQERPYERKARRKSLPSFSLPRILT
ncbi:MAG TPA: hypothetical protein VE986_00800, partial [Hyphomicrobiales bacterium]|nr:hypothetical protein [Hyphomicrobiales bacterium]